MITENLPPTEANESNEASKADEAQKPESVADTIRASISELKGETDSSDVDAATESAEAPSDTDSDTEVKKEAAPPTDEKPKKPSKKAKKEVAADVPEAPAQARYEAPNRWPVAKKEWFNKQPREAQQEILDGWGEIESHATKVFQDAAREKNEALGVNKILRHYRTQWNLKGITDEQAIAELCATQDNIINKPVETIDLIMRKRGITLEHLAALRKGGSVPATSSMPPEFSQLTETVKRLENELRSRDQAQLNTQQQSAVAEVESVLRETDSEGRYVYPELWDPAYRKRAEPFIDDARKTHGLSWAEATKRAVFSLRQIDGRPSPSSQQQKFSRDNEIAKVKAASVSVKGRGSAIVPTMAAAKPGESVKDSIRASIAELSQNNQH